MNCRYMYVSYEQFITKKVNLTDVFVIGYLTFVLLWHVTTNIHPCIPYQVAKWLMSSGLQYASLVCDATGSIDVIRASIRILGLWCHWIHWCHQGFNTHPWSVMPLDPLMSSGLQYASLVCDATGSIDVIRASIHILGLWCHWIHWCHQGFNTHPWSVMPLDPLMSSGLQYASLVCDATGSIDVIRASIRILGLWCHWIHWCHQGFNTHPWSVMPLDPLILNDVRTDN